jgi:hypothetical protein
MVSLTYVDKNTQNIIREGNTLSLVFVPTPMKRQDVGCMDSDEDGIIHGR